MISGISFLSSYHFKRKTPQSNYVSNYIREETIWRRKCSKWEYYTNLLCLAEGSKHLLATCSTKLHRWTCRKTVVLFFQRQTKFYPFSYHYSLYIYATQSIFFHSTTANANANLFPLVQNDTCQQIHSA